MKQWLREHRSHPYPNNQEKLQLAKQSSITFDQVTTWFNNARAILRRHQAKLRHSLDTKNDDDEELPAEKETYSQFNEEMSSKSTNLFILFPP